MQKKKFYITTTLPYTNSDPHIGFAAEIIKADVIARWYKLLDYEVFFNTGTDEHGIKIYQKAQEANLSLSQYCQLIVDKFYNLKTCLNLSFTNFIRTSDEKHRLAVQIFWQKCLEAGDIYKKNYKVKYCIGCEMEKTDSDLEKGVCPFHPNQKLEEIEEENYFFRFSKYQKPLLEFYEKNPNFVIPEKKFNEIKQFLSRGLKDFSISRLKEKMPNGIEVPNDENQVIYVWFDALINYISTLNWPQETEKFAAFWPGVQVCGKDNLRQQSAMWPAMLMSAGLSLPKHILVFGFLTVNGKKISKSDNNIIDPFSMVDKYGTDPLRYYLLTEISTFSDGDFSEDNLKNKYRADLSNVLGNFASRLTNLIEKNNLLINLEKDLKKPDEKLYSNFSSKMSSFKLGEAIVILWDKLRDCDEKMTKLAPWKINDEAELKKIIQGLTNDFYQAVSLAGIFLPQSTKLIIEALEADKIKKISPLFPKLD
jgi:methionyl-tRNA synthetase